MAGRLVISLDFELMWGVRDHRSTAEYGDAVMGGRRAIPLMLEEFERRQVRATWATVGFLFARNRQEILDHAPRLRADYKSSRTSPYWFIENQLGADEEDDPLHFANSLVRKIGATEGQEIATHSFSHFCCLEPGHSEGAFAADLASARSLAQFHGFDIRSLVFARNQLNEAYVAIAAENGIEAFRGNPSSFAYRPRGSAENSRFVRAMRLVDSIAPISSRLDHEIPAANQAITNVPASRFLRPYNPAFPMISKLQMRRIKHEMRRAARDHQIYHLWWHPHNFGRQTSENMQQLSELLDHFSRLRDRYGMQSANMADFL